MLDATAPAEKPTATLKAEHQVILRVLRVLQRLVARHEAGQGFEAAALAQCVRFFRLFADACHHGKEEDLLFPMLEQRGIPREGGPIGVMLHEHTLGRAMVKRMAEALAAHEKGDPAAPAAFVAAANDFHQLLSHHIFKEDNILFNMGDRVMSAADQITLCGRFGEVGCRAFEGARKEELARLADDLEQRWA